MQSSEFVDHSYDYRPNWTLASPVTIIDDNNTQEFRITVMFRILQTVSIAISNCDNEIIVNSGNMECWLYYYNLEIVTKYSFNK